MENNGDKVENVFNFRKPTKEDSDQAREEAFLIGVVWDMQAAADLLGTQYKLFGLADKLLTLSKELDVETDRIMSALELQRTRKDRGTLF